MKQEKREDYKHEVLMAELNLSDKDLPEELQKALMEFDRIDAKIAGHQPELEPASDVIAQEIREWYDEEEVEELPANHDERACHVAFYVVRLDVISPQKFRELGGKSRLDAKKSYQIGNFKLLANDSGKEHTIVSLQEK